MFRKKVQNDELYVKIMIDCYIISKICKTNVLDLKFKFVIHISFFKWLLSQIRAKTFLVFFRCFLWVSLNGFFMHLYRKFCDAAERNI